MNEIISVLTPTFNRESRLRILYNSLIEQKKQNFVWVVVDDGSTDNTAITIQNFIKEDIIPIIYIYKKNGGKHTAINLGVDNINTLLTIIVDSDDCLLPYATQIIEDSFYKYKNFENIAFFAFQRCNKDGNKLVELASQETKGNYIDLRIKGRVYGDMAEVFYTKVLIENKFPTFPNEKFLSEDVLWIEISKQYDAVFIDESIYECEYLEDGLTDNDKIMKINSPLGSMLRGKQLMYKKCGIINMFKGIIIYDCYKSFAKCEIPECLKLNKIYLRILCKLLWPFGKIYQWYITGLVIK